MILTGSRRYGFPREDSDIDLVVLIEDIGGMEAFRSLLETHGDPALQQYENCEAFSFRFDRINLIVCYDHRRYLVWAIGSQYLENIGPVTRETAVKFFAAYRIVGPDGLAYAASFIYREIYLEDHSCVPS